MFFWVRSSMSGRAAAILAGPPGNCASCRTVCTRLSRQAISWGALPVRAREPKGMAAGRDGLDERPECVPGLESESVHRVLRDTRQHDRPADVDADQNRAVAVVADGAHRSRERVAHRETLHRLNGENDIARQQLQ